MKEPTPFGPKGLGPKKPTQCAAEEEREPVVLLTGQVSTRAIQHHIAGLVSEVVRHVWAKEITGHAAIEAKFAEIRRLSDSGLQ